MHKILADRSFQGLADDDFQHFGFFSTLDIVKTKLGYLPFLHGKLSNKQAWAWIRLTE